MFSLMMIHFTLGLTYPFDHNYASDTFQFLLTDREKLKSKFLTKDIYRPSLFNNNKEQIFSFSFS